MGVGVDSLTHSLQGAAMQANTTRDSHRASTQQPRSRGRCGGGSQMRPSRVQRIAGDDSMTLKGAHRSRRHSAQGP